MPVLSDTDNEDISNTIRALFATGGFEDVASCAMVIPSWFRVRASDHCQHHFLREQVGEDDMLKANLEARLAYVLASLWIAPRLSDIERSGRLLL